MLIETRARSGTCAVTKLGGFTASRHSRGAFSNHGGRCARVEVRDGDGGCREGGDRRWYLLRQ